MIYECLGGLYYLITLQNILLGLIPMFYFFWYQRPSQFPPGPRGFPILGVIPYLSPNPARDFKKWSRQNYGPVMSVRFGRKEAVVLNTYDVIHEVLVKNSASSSDRPWIEVYNRVLRNDGILFMNYNDKFKTQKHFALKYLRGKGLAKGEMEEIVNDEGDLFIEYLSKFGTNEINIKFYSIAMEKNMIGIEGLSSLSRCLHNVEALWLEECDYLGSEMDTFTQALAELASPIKLLGLSGNNLGHQVIRYLSKCVSKIENLLLDGCSVTAGPDLAAFANEITRLPQPMQYLGMNRNPLGVDGERMLEGCRSNVNQLVYNQTRTKNTGLETTFILARFYSLKTSFT